MKKQLLTAVIAVVSLCACSERPGPSMGWTAQNAVDKLCGRYEVESLTWDGPEADINGDGIIAPTHLEELLQGPWDGIQDPGGPFVYVIPASELGKGTNVDAHLFIGFIDWPVKYSLMTLKYEYSVSESGEFTFSQHHMNDLASTSPLNKDHSAGRFDGESVYLDGDILVISGETSFYDFAEGKQISGREAFRFKCVSSKRRGE